MSVSPFIPFGEEFFQRSMLGFSQDGAFDHVNWATHLQGDQTSLGAQGVTLHEWSHHELNNVSSYGCLLTAVAQLSQHAKEGRERYSHLLGELVARCRKTHEIYATWYSTDVMSLLAPLQQLYSALPEEYRHYYDAGNQVVAGLESPWLRQQAFLCTLRICLESADLASWGERLDSFQLSSVRFKEYPDARFELVKKILSPNFFQQQWQAFMAALQNQEHVRLLTESYEAEARAAFYGREAKQADEATAEFHRWLHTALADLLETQGLRSNSYAYHLVMIRRVLPWVNEQCDPASLTHRLVASDSPYDAAATLMVQMESEIMHLRREPLPAHLLRLGDIPPTHWATLVTGDPPHLLFCVRYARQMLTQHRFSAEDAAYLSSMKDPVVFLRRCGPSSGGRKCEWIVFSRPEELRQFRRALSVKAYGLLSMAVLTDHAWCDAWLEAGFDSILCTVLFDQSLQAELRRNWPQFKTLRYEKVTLRGADAVWVALVFLAESSEGGSYTLFLAPCSDLFAKAAVGYIKGELSPDKFIHDSEFVKELSDVIPVLLTHLVSEDYFFSFNDLTPPLHGN